MDDTPITPEIEETLEETPKQSAPSWLLWLIIAGVLLISPALVCGLVANLMANAQLASCAVPSAQFINQEACREMVNQTRPLTTLFWAGIGAFGGFMILTLLWALTSRSRARNRS